MKDNKPVLLLDTCVISDFLKVDISVLQLASDCFGGLRIPRPLMKELSKSFDFDVLDVLCSYVIDIPADIRVEANEIRLERGFASLSECDGVCLLTALKRNYTCVTNDQQLRKSCEKRGVKVWWGLEIVLNLYEQNGIPFERAELFGVRLYEKSNFFKKEHLDEFRRRLFALKESK